MDLEPIFRPWRDLKGLAGGQKDERGARRLGGGVGTRESDGVRAQAGGPVSPATGVITLRRETRSRSSAKRAAAMVREARGLPHGGRCPNVRPGFRGPLNAVPIVPRRANE
jgi:hypothetical protein